MLSNAFHNTGWLCDPIRRRALVPSLARWLLSTAWARFFDVWLLKSASTVELSPWLFNQRNSIGSKYFTQAERKLSLFEGMFLWFSVLFWQRQQQQQQQHEQKWRWWQSKQPKSHKRQRTVWLLLPCYANTFRWFWLRLRCTTKNHQTNKQTSKQNPRGSKSMLGCGSNSLKDTAVGLL